MAGTGGRLGIRVKVGHDLGRSMVCLGGAHGHGVGAGMGRIYYINDKGNYRYGVGSVETGVGQVG